MPLEHLYFFCGVDPAPSESQRSDDGAVVIGAATPKRLPEKGEQLSMQEADWWFDYVGARRFTAKEKASARQWSGYLHRQHALFRFEKMMMDPNQGGRYIERELLEPIQLISNAPTEVVPIADQKTGPTRVTRGDFILHFWQRGDPGVEACWPGLAGDDMLNDVMYSSVKEDLDHGLLAWPARIEEFMSDPAKKELLRTWPEERRWSLILLTKMQDQFRNIQVATKEDGTQVFTKRGARQFSALGKKDFVSAGMMCRMAFRIWLRSGEWGGGINPEDEAGFSGW